MRTDDLVAKILDARKLYYAGKTTVADATFDAWIDELSALSPGHPAVTAVGAAPTSAWKKVAHQIPMGSLGKSRTPDEFKTWVAKANGATDFMVSAKCDGLSVALQYEKGKLVSGITRGSGQVGEDITSNAVKMRGVLRELPLPLTGSFRGEIVLHKADKEKHFPAFANPRNGAAGLVQRLDGAGSEHLTVYIFQAVLEGYEFRLHDDALVFARQLGFLVPDFSVGDTAHILRVYEQYINHVREALPYQVDGLVISVRSINDCITLGEHGGNPAGQTALKFPAQREESQVKHIEWSVGNIGRITPVAIIEPTLIDGSTVERATLHNVANVARLGVDVGAKILVFKAGEIIPAVEEVTESTGTVAAPPSHCPVCSQPVSNDGEYLVCGNYNCAARRAGRIQMWVGELGLLEWGEGVISKLTASGRVNTIADLYRLSVQDIATLERLGEKTAKKLRDNLWAATPIPLETILAGLSIPHCQTTTGRLVVHAGFDTPEKLLAVTEADLVKIPGLGPVKGQAVAKGVQDNAALILEIISLVGLKKKVVGSLSGSSVCFTGTLTKMPRKKAEQMVKDKGGLVFGNVSRGLTYLVMADPNSTSSKAVAARALGVKPSARVNFSPWQVCKPGRP